jgi:hypothetical protein
MSCEGCTADSTQLGAGRRPGPRRQGDLRVDAGELPCPQLTLSTAALTLSRPPSLSKMVGPLAAIAAAAEVVNAAAAGVACAPAAVVAAAKLLTRRPAFEAIAGSIVAW